MTNAESRSLAVDAALREYQNIWTELYNRWENQRNAFNYAVSLVAVTLGLAFARDSSLPPEAFFAFPFVIAPFAFIFFDNELMIWGIVAYSLRDATPRINELLGGAAPVVEFDRSRFKYFSPQLGFLHLTLSIGRWTIFVLPMAVSFAYAGIASDHLWRVPYVLVAAADAVLLAYFVWVMAAAAAERRRLWTATARIGSSISASEGSTG